VTLASGVIHIDGDTDSLRVGEEGAHSQIIFAAGKTLTKAIDLARLGEVR
jgi:hypothetical protein